jgi:aryl sulfotransferase
MTEGPEARLVDDSPACNFFAMERTWWAERERPNVLLVHYNDLKADLEGEMRRIAAFLGITIPENVWPDLVTAAGFEAMRKNGATLLPRAALSWDKGHERFINKGTNERWREELTHEDAAMYEARAAQELSPALSNWLTRGRLQAGDPRALAD